MKMRNDFVSNSSSSSFIIISDKGEMKGIDEEFISTVWPSRVVELPLEHSIGCKEFGWQCQKYYDVFSKLNWAAIIVRDKLFWDKKAEADQMLRMHVAEPWLVGKDMLKLLRKVCKEKFGLKIKLKVRHDFDEYEEDGFIDHQSAVYERPSNARMFESEKKLVDFLCNSHSYIDNANDNEGRGDEEEAKLNEHMPCDYET